MSANLRGNILLTGRPGIGKTTVIMRLAERLVGRSLAGFYTEEIREGGQRQGFRILTFSGRSGVLAHVTCKERTRVSRYGVDVAAFEELVVPELARCGDLALLDEIGKMECFSGRFVDAVRELLAGSTPVIATVASKGRGFIAEVKARPDVEIWQVTSANREELPRRLAQHLSSI